MLKMKIMDWKARIDRQFEAGLFDEVIINISSSPEKQRPTKEITNFEYCLQPEEIIEQVKPPVMEEYTERSYVIHKSIEVFEYLKHDINSRQAAFVNNYDGKDNHCIAYFHHYVRNNKYCMNVYVRSMNYKDNFIFDCQTFNLIYSEIYNRVKKEYPEVEQGFIRVFVFSLHIYR